MNDFARPIDITAGGRVSYGLDDGLLVEFYIRPKLMQALTEERSMPTYEDRIYTRIVSPGNTKTTWDYETKGVDYLYDEDGQVSEYKVRDDLSQDQCDPVRFPKAWERFTKKGEKVKEGWAILEWGAITRSFAETLKAQNIHTVEAMASLSDAMAANLMGGLKYRNLARAALDDAKLLELASKEQERANKAEETNKELREKLGAIEEMNKELHEKFKVMQAQIDPLSKKGKAA